MYITLTFLITWYNLKIRIIIHYPFHFQVHFWLDLVVCQINNPAGNRNKLDTLFYSLFYILFYSLFCSLFCSLFYSLFNSLAILVTGGTTSGSIISKSVEVLNKDRTPICMLPDIKIDNTQSWLVACCSSAYTVSSSNRQTCITFSSGVWSGSYTLINGRSWHTS